MQKPVTEKKKYFVVRERAVPEVLLKVVEAKKLLDSGKVDTVQDAAERTGIDVYKRQVSVYGTLKVSLSKPLPKHRYWLLK